MVRPMRYPELYEGPEQEAALRVREQLLRRLARRSAAEAILEELPKSTALMKAVQLRVLGGAWRASRTTPRRSATATGGCS